MVPARPFRCSTPEQINFFASTAAAASGSDSTSGVSVWLVLVCVLGALVLIVIIVAVIMNRRAKRKQETLQKTVSPRASALDYERPPTFDPTYADYPPYSGDDGAYADASYMEVTVLGGPGGEDGLSDEYETDGALNFKDLESTHM